ncbi:unnamed protein product [Trichogramma brassicae]|uniref:Uncharacterized protein n=1 Tax=Trichogramma brassicae TaxID=86971 RepID=A0A6H5IZ19_9HYME|nr:unnamed protein product [Trichogramma brassicae]
MVPLSIYTQHVCDAITKLSTDDEVSSVACGDSRGRTKPSPMPSDDNDDPARPLLRAATDEALESSVLRDRRRGWSHPAVLELVCEAALNLKSCKLFLSTFTLLIDIIPDLRIQAPTPCAVDARRRGQSGRERRREWRRCFSRLELPSRTDVSSHTCSAGTSVT